MVEKKANPKETGDKKAKKPSKKVVNQVKKSAKSAKKPAKEAQTQRKPKTSSRKKRSDSVENHVDIVQAAFHVINPPDHMKLLKAEQKFWDSIIDEFAKVEWTDHTLELAAMLARHMYALDLEQRKFRNEGTLLDRKQIIAAVKDKTTGREITPAKVVVMSQYLNPRKAMIQMYSDLIVKFRRSLSLHARGKDGEARDIKKRRTLAKGLENGVTGTDDDDGLLAQPMSIQ